MEFCEGQLLVTDVSTTCAEAILTRSVNVWKARVRFSIRAPKLSAFSAFRGFLFFIIILFLFCNICRTNTYTTYDTNIILTYIYIYITLLILTLFIQANRTNTYTTYSTYNTNIILTCTFTLHYSYLHYSTQRDFFIRFYNALAKDLTYIHKLTTRSVKGGNCKIFSFVVIFHSVLAIKKVSNAEK